MYNAENNKCNGNQYIIFQHVILDIVMEYLATKYVTRRL